MSLDLESLECGFDDSGFRVHGLGRRVWQCLGCRIGDV